MRQNHGHFFHKVIIASVCCIVLAGCGHKTDPVYVKDAKVKKVKTTVSPKVMVNDKI